MEKIGLMFSGGVDSVVCLSELVKQNITPVLFVFQTWKMSKVVLKKIKFIAKTLSPKSPLYVYKPRTIDYHACFVFRSVDKKSYFIHMDEYGNDYFYPLRFVDKLVLGYVGRESIGRRAKGELGLAQPEFITKATNYKMPFIFPLGNKTTRDVDKIFKELPEEIRKNTVSSTRAYKFGGAYLSD